METKIPKSVLILIAVALITWFGWWARDVMTKFDQTRESQLRTEGRMSAIDQLQKDMIEAKIDIAVLKSAAGQRRALHASAKVRPKPKESVIDWGESEAIAPARYRKYVQ